MNISTNNLSELMFRYLLIGIFLVAVFLGLRLVWLYTSLNGDDIAYTQYFSSSVSFFDYLKWRWETHSSRLLLECGLYLCLSNLWIFKVLVTFCFFSIPFLALRLINYPVTIINYLQSFLIFFLFNLYNITNAGWITTITHYLFPLTSLLIALYLLKEFSSSIVNVLAYGLIVYACNLELISSFAFFLLVYLAYTQKDYRYYIGIFLCFIMIMIALLCPGNSSRVINEAARYYPAWSAFGIFYKSYLSIISTCYYYFNAPNLIVPFVIGTLCVCVSNRLIFGIYALFLFYSAMMVGWKYGEPVSNGYYTFFFDENFQNMKVYFLIFVASILSLCCYLIGLLKIEKKQKKILLGFLGIGCIPRLIMGFSPSIFESATRTFMVTDTVVIFIGLWLSMHIVRSRDRIILIALSSILQMFLYQDLY